MGNRVVTAEELKAKCSELLREIEDRGGTITVTKEGRPVGILRPVKKKGVEVTKRRLDRQSADQR
jgi:prevent-host-death family protein